VESRRCNLPHHWRSQLHEKVILHNGMSVCISSGRNDSSADDCAVRKSNRRGQWSEGCHRKSTRPGLSRS
jgi:hypothetical protein